jgi:ADP-ribose pyrophosphatase YjhB (NUDIX family)
MKMGRQHAHCSYCGGAFLPEAGWPRTCPACSQITYRNPIPVAVLLTPVDDGLLCIERAIPPGVGKLALPGGYVDHAETWQAAAVRELWEETGIRIPADAVREFRVASAPEHGVLLVIGRANLKLQERELPPFTPTHETAARRVVTSPVELAFPLHTQAMADWFGSR